MIQPPVTIVSARGASLFDADGIEYADLSMGFGAAMLGHANEAVARAVSRQAARHASPGFFETDARATAAERLAPWLPRTHRLVGIYTGGAEAIETSMRLAAAHTGRHVFVGFAGAHHGRSFMARALGASGMAEGVHALPYPPNADSGEVVDAVERCIRKERPAALFVEPIHMSGGGHSLDYATLSAIVRIARDNGCLVVFDELLTGGYRGGPRFYFEGAGLEPDIVVAGKALAGGLPGAVVSADAVIDTRARAVGWRSTHTDHPLIAAAIGAAIGEFERRDPATRVAAFGDIVETTIPSAVRRGRAAMWCIEWPDESSTAAAFSMLLENRVVVSFSGRYVRLLPSLVMKPSALADVCRTIARVHDRTT